MTGVTFCSLACGRGRSNAVVSLGEKHRERNLWTGGWRHHLFSGGWQPFLQFWCNIIQGLHHQQLLLDILVAAIHTGSGAPVWSIQVKCLQQQLNQVKPNRPMA